MKKVLRNIGAVGMALLFGCGALSFAAAGYRSYDESVQEYPDFSQSVHDADAAYSVIVKTDGTRPDFRSLHPDYTVQGPDDTYVVCFEDASQAQQAIGDLDAARGVAYAEMNSVVVAQSEETPMAEYLSWGVEPIGIDTFAQQLLQREALESVTVAVVDSGVQADLPLFEGRLAEGVSLLDTPCTTDTLGHGTSVAGVIADCTQGLPVQIMPVKVMHDNKLAYVLDVANGVKYAVENGADIINMSFVASKCSQTLHDAVDFALDAGSLTVNCSGNSATNMDKKDCCPAHLSQGIVVSGCAEDGSLFNRSGYGSTVDLCAPAVDVVCVQPDGTTEAKIGTSFAAPHVAAVAAMLKMYMPGVDCNTLTVLLLQNVRDIGDSGFDVYSGWGVPDLRDLDGSQIPQSNRLVTNMKMLTPPNKTDYYYMEVFSSEGFSAQVRYSDGFEEVRTVGIRFFGTDSLRRGSNTITASYGGQSVRFDVQVKFHWWQWIIWVPLFGFIWYK